MNVCLSRWPRQNVRPVPVLDVLSLNSNSTFLFPKPQKPDHFDNLVTWCHHEVDICGFEENVFTANRQILIKMSDCKSILYGMIHEVW